MKLWVIIITTFLIQELVSVNASLLHAYQEGYNLIFVSAIFITASVLDVLVGHALGTWVQRKFGHTGWAGKFSARAHSLEEVLGDRGHKAAFTLLGFVNFNYVNAFLASWTRVPFLTTLKYLVLGDILWYCTALGMILGVSSFIDPVYAMYVVLGISLLFMGVSMYAHKKILRGRLA